MLTLLFLLGITVNVGKAGKWKKKNEIILQIFKSKSFSYYSGNFLSLSIQSNSFYRVIPHQVKSIPYILIAQILLLLLLGL